ncbi:MAG: hypothetical protein PUP92_36890, partial [Rhizonema sp. PD38]|nr:hypothetical protein [Rhizonema sp. PD38]
MAIFFDGATDTLATSVLNSIEWRIRYNVLSGSCPDSHAFRQVVPNAVDADGIGVESGSFQIESAPIAGSQVTTISWYSDEGTIRLRI